MARPIALFEILPAAPSPLHRRAGSVNASKIYTDDAVRHVCLGRSPQEVRSRQLSQIPFKAATSGFKNSARWRLLGHRLPTATIPGFRAAPFMVSSLSGRPDPPEIAAVCPQAAPPSGVRDAGSRCRAAAHRDAGYETASSCERQGQHPLHRVAVAALRRPSSFALSAAAARGMDQGISRFRPCRRHPAALKLRNLPKIYAPTGA